jgi:hypothetical protein
MSVTVPSHPSTPNGATDSILPPLPHTPAPFVFDMRTPMQFLYDGMYGCACPLASPISECYMGLSLPHNQ